MRWAAQRTGTWRWLDYEVPLVTQGGPEWSLNAYGILRASVPAPAATVVNADDGYPMFARWGTLLHFEIDEGGRTRREWTGIVKDAVLDGRGWTLEIVEFPGYLAGVPFEGFIRGVAMDPAEMFRRVVNHVQSWDNAWLGISVNGSTPVRFGTDLDTKVATTRAAMDARKKTMDTLNKTKATATSSLQDDSSTLKDEVAAALRSMNIAVAFLTYAIQQGLSNAEIATYKANSDAATQAYSQTLSRYNSELAAGKAAVAGAKTNKEAAKKAYDAASEAYRKAKDERAEKGGAYEILGTDLKDSYRLISDLAKTAGFEWTTETRYSEGAPDLRINISYPNAGGRRDDLVFDTAVNIVHELELDSYGEFANAAIGVGAGEGSKAIRRTKTLQSYQLRRPVVVEDKSLKTNAQVDAAMNRELALLRSAPYPKKISVRDHPNCRIGAWGLGDLITVKGVTRQGVLYSGLLRVVSWTRTSQYEADIELQPAATI